MILPGVLMTDSIFLISLLFVQLNQTNMFVVKMTSITARQKLIMTLMLTLHDFSIQQVQYSIEQPLSSIFNYFISILSPG